MKAIVKVFLDDGRLIEYEGDISGFEMSQGPLADARVRNLQRFSTPEHYQIGLVVSGMPIVKAKPIGIQWDGSENWRHDSDDDKGTPV